MNNERLVPLLGMERFSAAEPGRELHDGRELPTGRRVRGEEPGDPGEDQRALLRSLRPRVRLPDTCLEHLVPVEPGVLGEQRVTCLLYTSPSPRDS